MIELTITAPSHFVDCGFDIKCKRRKISEDRAPKVDPSMRPYNAIVECFGVRCGGRDGWLNGPVILEKANEKIELKFTQRKLGMSLLGSAV